MDIHSDNLLTITNLESLAHSRGQTVLRGPASFANGSQAETAIKAIAHDDSFGIAARIRHALLGSHKNGIDQFLLQEIENSDAGQDHDLRNLGKFDISIKLYAKKTKIGTDLENRPVFQYVIAGVEAI